MRLSLKKLVREFWLGLNEVAILFASIPQQHTRNPETGECDKRCAACAAIRLDEFLESARHV